MPTYDGRKLISETSKRNRNQCRVVITLEVELSEAVMKSMPSYHNDAIDFMRGYVAECNSLENFTSSLENTAGLSVYGTNIQVSK